MSEPGTEPPESTPVSEQGTPLSTRRIKHQAALASVALLAIAAVLVGALIHIGVLGQNRLSVESSERRVAAAIERTLDQLGRQAVDNAWWDVALENLIENFDPTWAAENVGRWMFDTYGMSATLVVGADDEVIYATVDGEPETVSATELRGGFAMLANEARSATMAESHAAVGLIRWRENIYAVGLAAITAETPTAEDLVAKPRPVLAFLQRIDGAYLEALVHQLQLQALKVRMAPDPNCNAWIDLVGPDGITLAGLGWFAPEPGSALFRRVIVPVLGAFALLGLIAFTLFRRVIRTAEALETVAGDLRRKEREARDAALEAEIASAAKSRFLSNVSHELRSPLHAIIGFASFLRDEKLGALGDPKYRDFADQIHDEGRNLNQIVDDLLDFTRLDTGRRSHRDEPVDFAYIARAVADTYRARAAEKGVALTFETPAADIPRLLGDERGLRQLVRHLIDNAVKFTAANGEVRIALAAPTADRGVTLTVSDTGIGMDRAQCDRMMAPFVQAEADIDRHHGGLGIGLALVRLLLRNHDAAIDVSSGPHGGTRISIAFPTARTVSDLSRRIDGPSESP